MTFRRSRSDAPPRDDLSWRHARWPSPRVSRFVVSFPKSGRTWLRALLAASDAALRAKPDELVLQEWLQTEAPRLQGHRVLFTHALASPPEEPAFAMRLFLRYIGDGRRVFLVRDPRDVVVSRFFQATRRARSANSAPQELGAFVRDPDFGIDRALRFMQACDESLRDDSGPALLVSYEDLHRSPRDELRAVYEFLTDGPAPDARALEDAVSFASFDNLHRLEEEHVFDGPYARLVPGDPDDPESFKVRRGVIGGYRDYLAPDDIAWVEERIAEAQPRALGYLEPGVPPARAVGVR